MRELTIPKGNTIEEMLAAASYVESDVYTGAGDLLPVEELVGVPFFITGFDIRKSTKYFKVQDGLRVPAEWVTVHGVMAGPRVVLFNDGGVGIRPVLEAHFGEDCDKNLDTPMFCKRGLRISEYEKTLDDGEIIVGQTAYIG
jgi:hypothetical protein